VAVWPGGVGGGGGGRRGGVGGGGDHAPGAPLSWGVSGAADLDRRGGGGESPNRKGYTIRTSGKEVTLTGGSARGVLYGSYDFIERVLGVRWFMPAALGEDIAPKKTIPFPELNVVWNPAFKNVYGLIWAGGPGAADWELRVRAKVGSTISFGHNWSNILPATPANRSQYPLAFAEVGGRRGSSPQLCSEDPDVVRLSVDAARRAFSANPALPLFSISPNDGYGFCEDDRCRRIDELYGVTLFLTRGKWTARCSCVLQASCKPV